MVKTRVISAVVLGAGFIGLIYLGGIPFLAGCLLICGTCAWEFGHIYDQSGEYKIPLFLLTLLVLVLILARWFIGLDASHRTMTFCLMAALLWGVVACEKQQQKAAISFAVLTTGVVYIGWLGGYMISIRELDHGFWRLILVLFLIWSADIGAFFFGRKLGKHKMLPYVSPKKSWEGYFFGIVSSIVIGIILEALIPAIDVFIDFKQVLVLAFVLSAACPLGDFGESMIKRSFGVKDSSNLIPGHGGFFDRFDSVFWAMPIGYYFFEAISLGYL